MAFGSWPSAGAAERGESLRRGARRSRHHPSPYATPHRFLRADLASMAGTAALADDGRCGGRPGRRARVLRRDLRATAGVDRRGIRANLRTELPQPVPPRAAAGTAAAAGPVSTGGPRRERRQVPRHASISTTRTTGADVPGCACRPGRSSPTTSSPSSSPSGTGAAGRRHLRVPRGGPDRRVPARCRRPEASGRRHGGGGETGRADARGGGRHAGVVGRRGGTRVRCRSRSSDPNRSVRRIPDRVRRPDRRQQLWAVSERLTAPWLAGIPADR